MLSAFALGVGFGALAAANVGPIWLLCARTAARFGWRPGVAIGAGAAMVDVAYASLGALGAAALLEVTGLRLALGVLGALVVVYLGARTVLAGWRIRNGLELTAEVVHSKAALRTGIIATASNPLTILTWAAVFTSASVVHVGTGSPGMLAFVAGIGLGSLAVHTILALTMARVGLSLNQRALSAIDLCAGAMLVLLGFVLGARAIAEARAHT